MERYDLVIVGGGAAAFAAATKATDLGASTAMINDGLPLGGTCVNVGCVPSKHLLEVGAHYYYPQHSPFRSILRDSRSPLDFLEAIREKDELIATLRNVNYREVLASMPTVTFYEGKARFLSPHQVEVAGEVLKGRSFIIATGSSPRVPPIPGLEEAGYLTNREALSLKRLPASMMVIGAGPLGLEFAQMYAHFGTKVAVLEQAPRILPLEEPEVSQELHRCLAGEGIDIWTGVNVRAVSKDGRNRVVTVEVEDRQRTFAAEEILVATGVSPNTKDLGLEKARVALDGRGFVQTNAALQTAQPHIFAAGDVVGKMFLETVAAKEGAIAAKNAMEGTQATIDYRSIPHAIFTSPQVASVGVTEETLMKEKGVCACRVVPMELIPKAKAVKDTRGVIKMVIDPETATIVGVHMVSAVAAEMIHEAVLAVKYKLSTDDIIDTVHVFPTFSEGIKMVAQAFYRDVSRMSCCIE